MADPFDRVFVGDIVTSSEIIRGGYVAVRGETIAAIGTGAPPPAGDIIDHSGRYIMPGLVDGHSLPPRHPDLAELQLARRVAEPVRASGQQHHRYPEVLTEALLQVQNRLHPVGGEGGAP